MSATNITSSLEEELDEVCNLEKLSPFIDSLEAIRYEELVNITASMASVYTERRSSRSPLGLQCAAPANALRSYMMSLMVANAVIEAKHREDKNHTVVVLGMGSGVDTVAALLANSRTRVIAYETEPMCVDFAKALFALYGVQDRVEIREEDFLNADMSGIQADVVINENIDTLLAKEPQLEAARAILPYTHSGTLFVPGGVDVYVEADFLSEPAYFGRIEFGKQMNLPVVLRYEFKAGVIPPNDFKTVRIVTDLLDYKGDAILREKGRGIPFLNLDCLAELDTRGVNLHLSYATQLHFPGNHHALRTCLELIPVGNK